jgi:hypothetical protein
LKHPTDLDLHVRCQWAGGFALLGAVLGMVADTLLLYHPDGGYFDGSYGFLRDISLSRILAGHYLGIAAIPLEAGGIYLLYRSLLPLGMRTALVAAGLGVYLIFPGVAYHASIYPFAFALQANPAALEVFRPFNEPLGLVFAMSFLALMLPVTVWMFRGRTALPTWYGWASPLLTYPLWIGLSFALPVVGNFLAPMGFNLSMAILFALLLRASQQSSPTKAETAAG